MPLWWSYAIDNYFCFSMIPLALYISYQNLFSIVLNTCTVIDVQINLFHCHFIVIVIVISFKIATHVFYEKIVKLAHFHNNYSIL